MAGFRKHISPATEAALWSLSNGRCYAPECPAPVIREVRPGVPRKNAQISHIRGVRRPRHDPSLTPEQCAAFDNLILLCLPHHSEVDDPKTGEKNYPPKLLREWKKKHEGSSGPALAALGAVDEETLAELLTEVFSPPVERLQKIAKQLEDTGRLTAGTVADLRHVVNVMSDAPAGPERGVVAMLADTAEIYRRLNLGTSAGMLMDAAEALGQTVKDLHRAAAALSDAREGMGF